MLYCIEYIRTWQKQPEESRTVNRSIGTDIGSSYSYTLQVVRKCIEYLRTVRKQTEEKAVAKRCIGIIGSSYSYVARIARNCIEYLRTIGKQPEENRTVNRSIGIDIGSSYLCAVQVARTNEEFCIEKVFGTQIRRSTDSPVEVLKPLFSRHGFDKNAKVALSMPHDAVFFRNLQTDSAGLEQISERNWSALEHNFPVEPEEIVARPYSYNRLEGEKYSVLTAASSRSSLQNRLDILNQARMRPSLVETPIFAAYSTIVVNHPEIKVGQAMIVYVDGRYVTLAVILNGGISVVRSIPVIIDNYKENKTVQKKIATVISREAKITWRKVFAVKIEQDIKVYIMTTGKYSDYMAELLEKKLGSETTVIDCCAKIENLSQQKDDMPICVAEGLALRVLAPERTKGINFLEADKTDSESAVNLRKEITVCAALIGAIVVFSLIGLFLRLSRLEAAYASIKNETTEIFNTVLPDEKIVNPLAQLQQKIESSRKDSRVFSALSVSGLSPLDILNKISTNSPSRKNIKVDNILIASGTVRINGTCSSFEPVYRWQRFLQEVPGLENIEVGDISKQSGSGLVEFTMLLSVSSQEFK
ncbi:MAG: hypothetical protein JW837_00905 [Sedimentisphaerales bacterium]|nr:hypothetical protein [Sedimentisphaerales bacterium]